MEFFIKSDDNNLESSSLFPYYTDELYISSDLIEQNLISDGEKIILCESPTKVIKNKNKNKESEDEMNQIKAEESNIKKPIKEESNGKKQISFQGRKMKGDSGSSDRHNKYSDDILGKKCKHLVLNNTFEFINEKIKKIYNGKIGYGRCIKQLLIINKEQKSNVLA